GCSLRTGFRRHGVRGWWVPPEQQQRIWRSIVRNGRSDRRKYPHTKSLTRWRQGPKVVLSLNAVGQFVALRRDNGRKSELGRCLGIVEYRALSGHHVRCCIWGLVCLPRNKSVFRWKHMGTISLGTISKRETIGRRFCISAFLSLKRMAATQQACPDTW
ncbi:unnamed protein product, partial [Ectocarpus sp. 12 AP-2014]